MNILIQEPIDIGMVIVDQLNEFIESKGKTPRFSTTRMSDSIYVNRDNTSGSTDFFEFRLMNEYTIGHFSFQGGLDNSIPNSRNITKDNWNLYIRCYNNTNGVYDSYNPMPSYNLSNLYFHWDVMEYDNYVCEVESVITNNKSGAVLMKEYMVNDVKLFRLTDGSQHCKIWFTNDGINVIPVWFKRLLVEYVMFY